MHIDLIQFLSEADKEDISIKVSSPKLLTMTFQPESELESEIKLDLDIKMQRVTSFGSATTNDTEIDPEIDSEVLSPIVDLPRLEVTETHAEKVKSPRVRFAKRQQVKQIRGKQYRTPHVISKIKIRDSRNASNPSKIASEAKPSSVQNKTSSTLTLKVES